MVLVLFLSCAFLVVASGQPAPATQCQTTFDNLTAASYAEYAGSFSTAPFNTTCLAASCPALTSAPCPYVSGSTAKTLNATAVQMVLATLSTCLQDQPSICSVPIRAIPAPCSSTITIPALTNSSDYTGNITLMPNTGFVFGLPSAILTYDPATGHFIFNLPLQYVGQFEVYVGFAGSDRVLHLTNVSSNVGLELGLETTIDPANETVTLVSNSVTKETQLGNVTPENPNDQANVTAAGEAIAGLPLTGTYVQETLAKFIGTLVAYALQLAENNC